MRASTAVLYRGALAGLARTPCPAEPLQSRQWPRRPRPSPSATTLPLAQQWRLCAHQSFSSNDPYEVLGLERHASRQQIVDAYHALALRWHPDRNQGDPDAEGRFKQVAAAYQALRDGNHAAGASDGFAEAAGVTREEADKIFREVFGSDTLSEMAAVFDLAERIQQRAYEQIREKYPAAEAATQRLVLNAAGVLVVRTVVQQRGQVEVHEHEVSAEEAEQLTEVGLGVLSLAGLVARDVTARLASEIGSTVTHGIAQGVFGAIAGGVHSASKLAEPFIPSFAHAVLPDLGKLTQRSLQDGSDTDARMKRAAR